MKKEFVFRIILAFGIFFLVYQFGVKPLFGDVLFNNTKTTHKKYLKIPGSQPDRYDVIVLGEEPEGIAAAISAARLGAKTLLLAEGKDLGGIISRSMLTQLEIPHGANNTTINAGILYELDKKLGKQFDYQKYISVVNEMVKNEKNIEVKYESVYNSSIIINNRIDGINVTVNKIKYTYKGRMFVDATRKGKLLEDCKIPYITGSEDLNMKDCFLPVSLNFEMKGKNSSAITNFIKKDASTFKRKIKKYEKIDINSRINDLEIYSPEEGRIVVNGLQIANINVADQNKIKNAYASAIKEAKNIAVFLSEKFEEFKGWKFEKAADEFYIKEERHYKGEYLLGVNDILGNKYYNNTVAMGAYPIDISKFANNGEYIAGKPVMYSIPIGCIIPSGIDNLLMVGAKISYSSLAASSAGTIGTGITTGESAGILSVYCFLNSKDPIDIEKEKNINELEKLNKFFREQGLYFPEKKIINKNSSNWSYPAVKQLLTLGLIAGGNNNNYYFNEKAKQGDLSVLLLNGVYRLDKNSYSLELDTRIRQYFNKMELTKEKAAEILEALYGNVAKNNDIYNLACSHGYINDVMQLSLKDKKVLTMDDVYYLSAYNIKLYTGKDIKD